jgi:hypothetical protein
MPAQGDGSAAAAPEPKPGDSAPSFARVHLKRMPSGSVAALKEIVPAHDVRSAEAGAANDPPVTRREIEPMGDQVSPPVGVPRASASGLFDVSSVPDPDPPTIPPYVGDLDDDLGLEGRLDAELGDDDMPPEEPPTVELDTRPDLASPGGGRVIHAQFPADIDTVEDDEVDYASELDEGEAVAIGQPAHESGPWDEPPEEERAADSDAALADDDEPARVPAAAQAPHRAPYGLVAGIILAAAVAGFFYGVMDRPDPPSAGPPPETPAATRPDEEPAPQEPSHELAEDEPVEAPQIDPKDAARIEAEIARARELHERGKSAQAHAVLDGVLTAAPNDPAALVLRSSIYIEERKLDDALSAAQASVAADPKFADGFLALGVIEHERGELASAVTAYRRYLALAPEGIYARTIERQLTRLERDASEGG